MNHHPVIDCLQRVLHPSRWVVAPDLQIRLEHHPREETSWELFLGHLLDASQTRERKVFESWHVVLEQAGTTEPILAVRWDGHQLLYLTRTLRVRGWETYEESPGVIQTRPAVKLRPEFVATVDLTQAVDLDQLEQMLAQAIQLAVLGTSRLPITSLETPLPAFALGQLVYLPRPAEPDPAPPSDSRRLAAAAAGAQVPLEVRARLLEGLLRCTSPERLAEAHANLSTSDRMRMGQDIIRLAQEMFHHLSLSPYTHLIDNLLLWIRLSEEQGTTGEVEVVDLLGYMLRHLVRHLTAFDLVQFHNLGANYPDALMLDTVLKELLRRLERAPDLLTGDSVAAVRRRRALRQGWMMRRACEGLLVPDVPTSPGESQQVLPDWVPRAPEEQIFQLHRRRRKLFEGDPIDTYRSETLNRLLQMSLDDLARPQELRELGTAVFLDRPLGLLKQPGEVDRTELFSVVAFSRRVAHARLDQLVRWQLLEKKAPLESLHQQIEQLPLAGFPAGDLRSHERPGVVSLRDALRVADDFRFLSTTLRSRATLMQAYDFGPLAAAEPALDAWFRQDPHVLLVPVADPSAAQAGRPVLTAYDAQGQTRLQIGFAGQPRYVEHLGREYLADGLVATAAQGPIHLPPQLQR